MGQFGFFDAERRLAAITATNGAAAMTEYEKARRNQIRRLRGRWLAEGSSTEVPLRLAYRLLTDEQLDGMLAEWAVDVSSLGGVRRYAFPPRTDERYLFPDDREISNRAARSILALLRDGELVATGLNPAKIVTGVRDVIPADRWRILTPNFERETADHEGHPISFGILISKKPCEATGSMTRTSQRRRSRRELNDWMRRHQDEWNVKKKIPAVTKTEELARKAGFGPRQWIRAARKEICVDWPTGSKGKARRRRTSSAAD
jgi:hypothetical protein